MKTREVKSPAVLPSKLTYPAPRRVRERDYDRPWTVEDIRSAWSAGCYFQRNCHDFADEDAETLALAKKSRTITKFLQRLTPEQLEVLQELLTKELQHEQQGST